MYQKHDKYLGIYFFVGGFLFDILTLGRIDDLFNILSQILYLLFICGYLILETMEWEPQPTKNEKINKIFEYRGEIFHFFLGALLSAFTIFYFKSSSIANSFLFMFLMIFLLVINEIEFFKKLGPTIKSILIKVCLVSFFIYFIPVLIGKVGFIIYLLSLLTSLGVTFLLAKYLDKKKIDKQIIKNKIVVPHCSVVIIFVVLYLFKIIPPVPLSIQKIGVYHNIVKAKNDLGSTDYKLYHEKPWWKIWQTGDQDFSARTGDKVYIFARIFSPGDFDGKVFLTWFYKNRLGNWERTDKIPLSITGGRKEGFRGFAYKSRYTEGSWRVKVESSNGLEIGRINFSILTTPNPNETTTQSEPRKFKEVIQ